MESNWLDSYYESLEFLYWEPQHVFPKSHTAVELETLAKIAKQPSRLPAVRKHLREMEVTLNHNIRQFFLLAPDALRNKLFNELFGLQFGSEFVMYGSEIDTDFKLANCMQPDFLFVSETEIVCIEMKIAAKCSVDQVLKYALLGLAIEIKQERQKEHYLVLLGSGDFVGMFRERFESMAKLTEHIRNKDLNSFLLNKPAPFRKQPERLKQIVEQMDMRFLSYGQFARFLGEAEPPQTDKSPGAEVYRNLISGLVAELNRRKLS